MRRNLVLRWENPLSHGVFRFATHKTSGKGRTGGCNKRVRQQRPRFVPVPLPLDVVRARLSPSYALMGLSLTRKNGSSSIN